jgi:SAM-dependent methyltransferase
LIGERAAARPILELGCGGGRDSESLVAAGHRVVGIDLSQEAIDRARQRVPAARFVCQDVRADFPVAQAGVVVASLALHYFPWSETEVLVARIRDTLLPGGVLLCRLNSTNDHHFGASGHLAIEPDFFLVDGRAKRFFDRATVDRLFAAGWNALSVEERVIDRYDHPKAAWEAVFEKQL